MSLNYLEFDYSEDTEGVGSYEAMASVGPAQLAAVLDEVAAVLAWAHEAFAGERGPVAEGAAWDYDLQGQREYTVHEALHFDAGRGAVVTGPEDIGVPRHTVTLTLTGGPAFCEAFRARFLFD